MTTRYDIRAERRHGMRRYLLTDLALVCGALGLLALANDLISYIR
jgi:hypothetical protein